MRQTLWEEKFTKLVIEAKLRSVFVYLPFAWFGFSSCYVIPSQVLKKRETGLCVNRKDIRQTAGYVANWVSEGE